ncbi:MAG TPA: zinc ABC transporter substrate-binding protein [Thermoanaerobaculia bacterium]|nr:zinc ABC transporter substrate-binding protein [Thermoanaerobaculia bacterium]
MSGAGQPVAGLAGLLLLVATATGCGRAEPEPETLLVVATLPPLAALAAEVGGEGIEVRALLGPRDDPEASPFSMEALRTLARADLVVAVGSPALAAEHELLATLDPRRGDRTVLLCEAAAGCGGGPVHDGASGDPHLWLDPEVMVAAARRLAGALARLEPERALGLERRTADRERRVGAADARIRERLAPLAGGLLFVEHPTWERFASRYGIRQLALEREEREPTPRGIRAAIDEARHARVRMLLVTAGGRNRLARTVARELDVPTVEVEPLAYDWLASLERVATLVAAAPGPR